MWAPAARRSSGCGHRAESEGRSAAAGTVGGGDGALRPLRAPGSLGCWQERAALCRSGQSGKCGHRFPEQQREVVLRRLPVLHCNLLLWQPYCFLERAEVKSGFCRLSQRAAKREPQVLRDILFRL